MGNEGVYPVENPSEGCYHIGTISSSRLGQWMLRSFIVRLDGVTGCEFGGTYGNTIILTFGDCSRQHQLDCVAEIIKLLHWGKLHSGRIKGPLADELLPLLAEPEQPPKKRRARWLPRRGTR